MRYRERQSLSVDFWPGFIDALLAVANGDADAFSDELAVVNYIRKKQLIEGLDTVGFDDGKKMGEPLHLAVRGDWPELARLMDKAMDATGSAEYAELEHRWFAAPGATPIEEPIKRRGLLEVMGIVLVGLVVLALLLWVLTRFGGRVLPVHRLISQSGRPPCS